MRKMEVGNRRRLLDNYLSALVERSWSSVCTDRDGAGDNYIQEIVCSRQNEALGNGLDIQEDIIVKE